MQTAGPIVTGRAPRPVASYIFVLCEQCDRWISDEDRHECVLDPAYQKQRNAERTAAQHKEWGPT